MENPNCLRLFCGSIARDFLKIGNGGSNEGNGVDQTHREDQIWTNERHLNFLTSLENTFVKTVVQSHRFADVLDQQRCCHRDRHLLQRRENIRVDRHIPDISESTRDLHTIRNTSRSVQVSDLVSRSGRRHNKERATTHPYKISVDEQVVPEAEDKHKR